MACHARVVGHNLALGQPEVNLGITPGYGGTQRLVQYIGKTKALELLMTADMIDAQEAYRLGLVNAVVPSGEEVAAAEAMLQKIAAKAVKEGYGGKGKGGAPVPYNGYFFRILTAQGAAAPGGKYDYKVKGKLFGGFAVVAFPAKYGVSGVMSFLVNHDGVVYEADLGKDTAAVAGKLARFDPDKRWKKAPQ